MSISDVICTCGAVPERDSMGNALPCMRCYFSSSDRPHERIAKLESALVIARTTNANLHVIICERDAEIKAVEDEARNHALTQAELIACREQLERERAAHARTQAELAAVKHDRDVLLTARERYLAERDGGDVGRARTQAEAAAMRDWVAAWLIRARLAIYREGWEEGMSETEAAENLTSVLFNLGCDDGSERPRDIAETKRLLALPVTYSPPGGRALAERVTLWRELERIGHEIKGTGGTNPDDGPFSRLRGVLAQLAALDNKQETT